MDGPNLASCPSGTAIFTTLPIALDDFIGWVPLGSISPPGHTFPSDHQGIYVNDPAPGGVDPARTVRSPGTIHILRAGSSRYHETDQTDYFLNYQPCAEIYGYFGHIQSITPSLAARLGPFDQFCNTYSPNPGLTVTQCQTRSLSDVTLTAGEEIGTTGGVPGQFGLDVGLHDRRIPSHQFANPSRWETVSNGFDRFHVVGASDYFAEPARSEIASKLGSYNGLVQRTVAPLGGTVAVDLPGTAQGAWFKPGQPTFPESPHLALVPDNVDPTYQWFSVGTSIPDIRGVRFQPATSGTINRGFDAITPGSTIYCYEGLVFGILLLRLESATSLTLEHRTGTGLFNCTTAAPLAFSAAAVRFDR